MTSAKGAAFWSLPTILAFGLLPFVVHPALLTGRYYEITFTAVEFAPDGNVEVTFDDVLAHETGYRMDFVNDENHECTAGSDWSMRSGGLLWWPRKSEGHSVKLCLSTEAERRKGVVAASLRERLLITKGTYRIPMGGRLEWYRRTNPDGSVTSWFINAQPGL